MISPNGKFNQIGWSNPPLCCRYSVAFFSELSIQVREGAITARTHTVQWGLAFLNDGGCEMLGTWFAPSSGEMLWRGMLEDLKIRGVETVRFFVCQDPAQLRADACGAYPGTTVLPSLGHLLSKSLAEVAPRHRRALADAVREITASASAQAARDALNELAGGSLGASYPAVIERLRAALDQLEPSYALAPRLRRVLLGGDGVVQQLHQKLIRAVARHGTFENREAAMSFVGAALARAERLLDADRMDRAPAAAALFTQRSVATQAVVL